MEKETIRRSMWTKAGIAGLELGLISSAYMFATILMEKAEMNVFLNSVITFVLWAAKFAGCIWLMMKVMKSFAAEHSGADNKDTFRLGMATAFLSALVFAAVSFANVAYISAETFNLQMEAMMQQMAPMMDSNSMTMMEKMLQNMPQITFFSNLIYCTLYGIVLSAIVSRNIPARDPFADYKPEEQ